MFHFHNTRLEVSKYRRFIQYVLRKYVTETHLQAACKTQHFFLRELLLNYFNNNFHSFYGPGDYNIFRPPSGGLLSQRTILVPTQRLEVYVDNDFENWFNFLIKYSLGPSIHIFNLLSNYSKKYLSICF